LKVFEKVHYSEGGRVVDQDWEFALSGGTIHVGRYQPVHFKKELASISNRSRAVELEIGTKGLLQTLRWKTFEEPTILSEDEVLVECRCAGLNFRVRFQDHRSHEMILIYQKDVLGAMGLVDSLSLGLEGSGTILAVGSAVSDLQIGDRVM
jgi:short-subunit dehydrogenase